MLTEELFNRPVGKPNTPEEMNELRRVGCALIAARTKAGPIMPMEILSGIIVAALIAYNEEKLS